MKSLQRLDVSRASQQGVVLAVTLIVLVILLIAAAALIRSVGTSVQIAGSLAERRDLLNVGEHAVSVSVALFRNGTLSSNLRQANQPALNYSACMLPTDANGLPTVLQDDSNFATSTDANSSWTDPQCMTAFAAVTNDFVDSQSGTVVRYVIDRQCSKTGAFDSTYCAVAPISAPQYGCEGCANINASVSPVYRISVRVTNPKGARVFLQSTLSN